jgi:hypothetical protein
MCEDFDMPQPLSRVKPDAAFTIGAGGIRSLDHNPYLGKLAMEAIISWAHVEMSMLNIYINLMGGLDETAATAYLAVEIQSAKIAMINAVARAKLDQIYYDLLQDILFIAKRSQKMRDKLAHWIWGFSASIPDGYLLADPKQVAILAHRAINTRSIDKSHIFVFYERDFLDIISMNDRLARWAWKFNAILTKHPANHNDRLFHQLCAEPEIQEKIAARQASQTQSPPKV